MQAIQIRSSLMNDQPLVQVQPTSASDSVRSLSSVSSNEETSLITPSSSYILATFASSFSVKGILGAPVDKKDICDNHLVGLVFSRS